MTTPTQAIVPPLSEYTQGTIGSRTYFGVYTVSELQSYIASLLHCGTTLELSPDFVHCMTCP
jgi:hypothetical protein